MRKNHFLLGREKIRTWQVIAVTIIIFMISSSFRYWYIHTIPFDGFWFLTSIIGGTSALLSAYWNDGIVVSCLPGLAFTTGIMIGGRYELWLVLVGVAVVVGVCSYSVGRGIRVEATTTGWNARDEWIRNHLFGTEEPSLRIWGIVGIGLGVTSFVVMYILGPNYHIPIIGVTLVKLFFPYFSTGVVLLFLFLAWIGLAAVPPMRGSGLIGSWCLVFTPLFAAGAVWLPPDPNVPSLIAGVEWAF